MCTFLLNTNTSIHNYTESLRSLQCPCSLRQECEMSDKYHILYRWRGIHPECLVALYQNTRCHFHKRVTLIFTNPEKFKRDAEFYMFILFSSFEYDVKERKHFAEILKEIFIILKLNSIEAGVCDFRSVSCKHSSCYWDFLLTLSREDEVKR